MIKVIIFDLGGVVLNDPMNLIYEEVGKKFNIDSKSIKNVSRSLRSEWQKNEISSEEFWKQLALGLKISDVSSLKNLFEKTFIENIPPNKKTIEIVNKLKTRGYKVALLSNIEETHASYIRGRKYFDFFSPVFLSYELGMRKPEKEIYEYVIKKMKVKFEECVFIDNKEENVEAAKKLGIKTILFKSAEQLEKDLKKIL